jgi:hypothetical protein
MNLLPFKRAPSIDRYHVSVITSPQELEIGELLPIELRYILASRPSRHEVFRTLLEQGFGIGVRTVDKTPERVLVAVDRISRTAQYNTLVPWLHDLLRDEAAPTFAHDDVLTAQRNGFDLHDEAKLILSQRFEFKKIILVPLHNQQIGDREQKLIQEVNEDLYPHAIDVVVNRITFDNVHTRTEIAQTIMKALVIIGPIAHLLEGILSGVGKLFAATADDLLYESAELFALRGSGFTWRQLGRRSYFLVPVFLLATYGALNVEPLLRAGRNAEAGIVFGLSAVALTFAAVIQSIALFRKSFERLVQEGKLRLRAGESLLLHAIRQDFMNPARLGLLLGAIVSPLAGGVVFFFAPGLAKNGWVLALLAATESVVAGLTIMSLIHINRWVFRARVRRAIMHIVSSTAR